MLQVFESQGITFRDVLIDDSLPEHGSINRKPGIGMVVPCLQDRTIDWRRSAMVGDRDTDMAFACNLGIRGFQLRPPQFGGEWEWAGIAHALVDAPRHALVRRNTPATSVRVQLVVDMGAAPPVSTGFPAFHTLL